ncbi:hypothetical protein AWB74_04707 [Caballeronia arvi]|uniref:Uncharacterized protein n=1 Tax=Caballeronia arvi TaxID=1777135 RepID=A0A158K0P1_9BURK|nr:hypothetical protein [Caballeronia arvi]SAL74764.1 hypothetical protein AWB74_04707 [Caballeronia arvi]
MNPGWIVPDVPKHEYGEAPPLWIPIAAFVLMLAAGIIITVLNWKQGESIASAKFFFRALGVPSLLWCAVCGLIYNGQEEWIKRVDWWNYLCDREHAEWRYWTQAHWGVVDSVAVTPESDLAQRLLGLKGSAPNNANQTKPLPQDEAARGQSRSEQVIERLVTPFAGYLTRFAGSRDFSIVLVSEVEGQLTELRAALKALNIRNMDLVKVSRIEPSKEAALGEVLSKASTVPDFCLMLGWQLHTEDSEPLWSEAGAALLLASPSSLIRNKIKPQARMFRSIHAASDAVYDALKTLLAAAPTPIERIKHLWLSGMPAHDRNATLAAVKDVKLDVGIHDVDHAIGKPGPINSLLLQALAAEMVQHGQGAQLIAAPAQQGVALNLVGAQPAPVASAFPPSISPLAASTTFGTLGPIILMLVFIESEKIGNAWFWGVVVFYLLTLGIQVIGGYGIRDGVTDDFRAQLRQLGRA